MTARADPLPARAHPLASSVFFSIGVSALLAGLCAATPAAAQVGVTVSAFSDARFRGYSLSGGHPAGFIDVSFDDPGGFYAALSLSAVADPDGPQPLGIQLNGGYAKQLLGEITVDSGVIHSEYARYSTRGYATSYTEVYAGLSHGALSSRIFVSPHYFHANAWTIYGEVDGNFRLTSKLRATGHLGMLVPLHSPADVNLRSEWDWRLGLTRQLGRVSLQLAWTGARPARAGNPYRSHRADALVAGFSWVL